MTTAIEMSKRVRYQHQVLSKRESKGEATTVHLQRLLDLEKLVQDFGAKQAAIQQDPRYTGEGKAQQLATAVQEFAVSLGWLWNLPTVLEEASQRLKNLLNTKPKLSAGNEVVAYLREAEIRQAVKTKTQSQLDELYGKAIQEGREEMVRALVSGPLGSLVTPMIQTEVETIQARASNPAAFQALQELTEIRSLADELVKQFASWLKGLGADPENKAAVIVKAA